MAREYRYVVVDVFTETPLLGNQLAVFLDAAGLTTEQMQAMAKETNLSETSFCFPRQGSPEEAVAVRIFTTEEELPFAGHPTLGTAAVLRWTLPALHDAAVVRLRLAAGTVPVRFRTALGEAAGYEAGLPFGKPVYGEMDQPLPEFGKVHEAAEVAAALGLPVDQLDPGKPAQTVSTGIAFVVVPLVSEAALQALDIPQQGARRFLAEAGARFFYVVAPGTDPTEWHARMQFYGGEDPATGSGAGCATAYLVWHDYAPSATPLVLRQGKQVSRASTLHCQAELRLREQTSVAEGRDSTTVLPNWQRDSYVRVGGSTVLVAEGRFFLF